MQFAFWLISACFIGIVFSHGRFIEQPSRTSAWRFGFGTSFVGALGGNGRKPRGSAGFVEMLGTCLHHKMEIQGGSLAEVSLLGHTLLVRQLGSVHRSLPTTRDILSFVFVLKITLLYLQVRAVSTDIS
jgi:hypothetical protein